MEMERKTNVERDECEDRNGKEEGVGQGGGEGMPS
jgi:hypothetical protein